LFIRGKPLLFHQYFKAKAKINKITVIDWLQVSSDMVSCAKQCYIQIKLTIYSTL